VEKALNEKGDNTAIDRIEKFIKHIDEYLTYLPDTPDQILLILKGHLLVEQEINCLLEAKDLTPYYVPTVRLLI
jgi:hypothetical protein